MTVKNCITQISNRSTPGDRHGRACPGHSDRKAGGLPKQDTRDKQAYDGSTLLKADPAMWRRLILAHVSLIGAIGET
jgi:hypothetical protein